MANEESEHQGIKLITDVSGYTNGDCSDSLSFISSE